MSAFVPSYFNNFGKSVKDLFKKKYDFDHRFKSVRKASGGVTFESGAIVDNGNVRGYVKQTLVQPKYTVEGEANTDPAQETKLSVKSSKLANGLTVEAKANTKADDKAFTGPIYVAEAQYAQEHFAGSVEFKTDRNTHRVKATSTVGYDGISFGGAAVVDVSKGAEVVDYNLGLEYSRPNYTATLFTEKQADFANLSYFHRVDAGHTVGAQLKLELGGKHSHDLTIGNEYAIDANSSLKSKVNLPSSQVSFALEHRLRDPSIQFNVAAAFNPSTFARSVKAESFGFGVTVGDY